MRIVMVWLVAITLIFVVSVGWYISQPIVVGVARAIGNATDDPNATNIASFVEYSSYLWGPLFIIFLLLWAMISSQRRDVESEIYG